VTRRAQELFMGAATGTLDLHPEWREFI
jgi:hypothetical protein